MCLQRKTPDDGQRNCSKHVEFYSKNEFEEISASSWFYYKNVFCMFMTYSISYWQAFGSVVGACDVFFLSDIQVTVHHNKLL